MARRKKERGEDKAQPDLTPMIDVTFQLLIFFILCTRFKVEERNHRTDLPLDEGMQPTPSEMKEQVTVYCEWNDSAKTNHYQVAIGARDRQVVPNTLAGLSDMIIFPGDTDGNIAGKRELYRKVFDALVGAIESKAKKYGDNVQKVEISFAANAMEGASSGTAPWMFVSLAVDAVAEVNMRREEDKKLPVTFKFVNAMEKKYQ